jgi:hypothetical protein
MGFIQINQLLFFHNFILHMYPARNKEGEPTIVVENLKIN